MNAQHRLGIQKYIRQRVTHDIVISMQVLCFRLGRFVNNKAACTHDCILLVLQVNVCKLLVGHTEAKHRRNTINILAVYANCTLFCIGMTCSAT